MESAIQPGVGIQPKALPEAVRKAWIRFGLAVLALAACFIIPLWTLAQLAMRVDIHSHVLLVPLVSAYLIWIERTDLPLPTKPDWWVGILSGITAGALLLVPVGSADVQLTFRILALVFAVTAAGSLVLGTSTVKRCLFSFGFLVFMAPLPKFVIDGLETALQHVSADAADWWFVLTRIPSVRDGLFFRLPGLTIEVAQECSGFRSTLVLFIVSQVAARMFLKSAWRQALLVLVIIPLGILRNAFRIWVLAVASVYIDPRVIDSPLHHQGGPIFFLISLVPLFAFLWILYRSERSLRTQAATGTVGATLGA